MHYINKILLRQANLHSCKETLTHSHLWQLGLNMAVRFLLVSVVQEVTPKMEKNQRNKNQKTHKQTKIQTNKAPKNILDAVKVQSNKCTHENLPQSAFFSLGLQRIRDFFVHNHKIQTTIPNHKIVIGNTHIRPSSSSCSPYYPLEKVPTFLLSHSDSLLVCTSAKPETEEGMSHSRH